MTTDVIHVRDREAVSRAKQEGRFLSIHRPGPYGNPFVIGKDGTREEVIERYRLWLLHSPDARFVRQTLPNIKGHALACFCRPALPCHGDILAKAAEEGLDSLLDGHQTPGDGRSAPERAGPMSHTTRAVTKAEEGIDDRR